MNQENLSQSVGVGLLGCGTVGTGVIRLLASRNEYQLCSIGVRDAGKARDECVDRALLTEDLYAVVHNDDVNVVVEVMGGLEPARSLILEALSRKKHVVTANKALLAKHGRELFECASKEGVLLMYEAAVAGGVPVIRALRESLTGDRVQALHGIVNGTSNYMLTKMFDDGVSFEDALEEAQRLGFAEADPSADVEGHDAAQKLHLLMHLGFGLSLDEALNPPRGITALSAVDFRHAQSFGYRIKPLAVARRAEGGVIAWVGPALVPETHVLSNIGGVYNACFLHSEALGALLMSGRGAGMMPTAVSVVGDVIECGRTPVGRAEAPAVEATAQLSDVDALQRSFYLRFSVQDEPGVLGRIAGTLGQHGVSIERLVQEEQGAEGCAHIVALTHQVKQSALKAALQEVDATTFMVQQTLWIPVEDPDQ